MSDCSVRPLFTDIDSKMDAQYTLPGVMQFLRSEWQQREQLHIEWELERADLLSRLGRLDSENIDLRRDLNEARRHLEILMARPRPGAENGGEIQPPNDLESAQRASDDLMTTVKDSKSYLKQCVADIRHVLRQSGTLSSDSDAMIAFRSSQESQNAVTLANFGSSALSICILPPKRIVVGTITGDLLIWDRVDAVNGTCSVPKTFDTLEGPVNGVQYSEVSKKLLVATGNEVRVYNPGEMPELITSQRVTSALEAESEEFASSADNDATIVHLVVAPSGNMLAVVLSDGRTGVWALENGERLKLLSTPATGVLACAFANIEDEIHLVLAQGPEGNIPDNAEGSLLLADPISGELLKKILFLFTAGISAMTVTEDSIVLGTESGDLRVIGLVRGETLADTTAAHRGEITSLCSKRDHMGNKTLVSTSIDGRVSVWELPALVWKGRLFSHDSACGALASCSGQELVAVSGGDGIIRVYAD